LLLTPAVALLLLTTTYPLLYAFVNSFRYWLLSRPGQERWVGLENYARAFEDSTFLNSLVVSVNYTLIAVIFSVSLGLAIALLLQKASRLHTFVKVLLIFPFAVSPALKGFSFRFMLDGNSGIFDAIADQFILVFSAILTLGGLIDYPAFQIGGLEVGRLTLIPALTFPVTTSTVWLGDSFWALFWMAMSEVWGWAPLFALMFLGALGSIPDDIFNAARIDGANSWRIFWHITLPLLRPVLLIVTLLKIIFSLRMFDQVVTMTGGGPGRSTQTINHFIYQVGFGRSLDMGYASALAYVLVIALSIFAFLYVKLLFRQT
jgi:multiple sugar transport system permease protein